MLARGRGMKGCRKPVDLEHRPTAHDRDRTFQLVMQVTKKGRQRGRYHDQFGRCRDPEQRAVEIEKKRGFPV